MKRKVEATRQFVVPWWVVVALLEIELGTTMTPSARSKSRLGVRSHSQYVDLGGQRVRATARADVER
jgi:hypothetical protein